MVDKLLVLSTIAALLYFCYSGTKLATFDLLPEMGKVTFKSNADEVLNNDFSKKSNTYKTLSNDFFVT